ncbi:MAG: hypothetical protein JWN96_708, partial [Mycobacterium sp.]|nr:hypothetical protein [Mycobacterium sp.]
HLGDTSLNVILFVPLGLAIGLLGRSPATARMLVAVLALPLAIEAIQSLLPMLGRGCQSGDVVDNLLGLGIGLALGMLPSAVRPARNRGLQLSLCPTGTRHTRSAATPSATSCVMTGNATERSSVFRPSPCAP